MNPSRKWLRIAVLAALGVLGSGTLRAAQDHATAAETRPNVLVIETDDQTVESMRVMANVNSLIGAQGATFQNNFVNFSLCCPSRSTFLTGQYAHNHEILDNRAPAGGFDRFESLHGDNNLAVWLQDAGYDTALIGNYLTFYANKPPVPPGWSEWQAAAPDAHEVYDYTLNENGTLVKYGTDREIQAGRADPKGGGFPQAAGAEAPAILPLADVHGPTRRRPESESESALRLQLDGEAGDAPRPRVRLRAAADASELQRGRRLRQAG